ncbi:unnamed protein product [Pieris brassicae]|uniref:Uncharacterized protein n=1 Tax=Pieris brassicae TaxID=7116 RepID=A0A9P0XI16_PIEBR|nr:unnamed protein product [Pieris brassicae]
MIRSLNEVAARRRDPRECELSAMREKINEVTNQPSATRRFTTETTILLYHLSNDFVRTLYRKVEESLVKRLHDGRETHRTVVS